DLIATYKEVKKAANYQELGEGTKKFQKQMEELTEAQKAQAAQMEICFMSLCLTSFALVCV
ncbi:MAG: hypothetical protein LBP85_09145, partial [Prevotellaceae bacterium]|nr:hypothetical protein [Prevotellaceae bacterium]